jgi:hypothetical protein
MYRPRLFWREKEGLRIDFAHPQSWGPGRSANKPSTASPPSWIGWAARKRQWWSKLAFRAG